MKHKLTACAIAILLTASAAFAQSEKPNVVKINPLGALAGLGSLAYERAITDKSSLVLAPTFGFFKSGGSKLSVYGLGAEYRFYFTGLAPEGTYFAPGVGGVIGTAKDEDNEKATVRGLTAKLVIGHQWIWNGGFTLDLNGGIQYINLNAKDNNSSYNDNGDLSGILPALSVGIGFNF